MLREIDPEKVLLVICLTVLIVGGLNALVYAGLRRGDEVSMINLARKATRRVRNPWQDEEQNLLELSRLVSALMNAAPGEEEQETGSPPVEEGGETGRPHG
jgi:hypothetical protein